MSPFIAYHATVRRHREGIAEYGLLMDGPALHRPYPFGVYVFNDDFTHPTFSRSKWGACWWGYGPSDDVWLVAYIGPMAPDPLVENGMILLHSVPPSNITLIRDHK